MKLILIPIERKMLQLFVAVLLTFTTTVANSQISLVCTNPTNTIYGLTANGEIYTINSNNAQVTTTVKNNSYPGNGASSANGIGYNSFNSRFYYFKRNVGESPQEFVSFQPSSNTVRILATSTCTDEVHTGCVSFNGAGYYTIDVQGTLHYYDIAANTWTFITSNIRDQNNNNVTNIIKTQNAGDMAIDGLGRIWLVTSSDPNWGLYRFPSPMPTAPVAQLNVTRVISPTATTPTGRSFAGIAFKPDGRIYMSTRADNRLYLLQPNNTLSFVGTFTTGNVGNDLTSCSFPTSVLPVTWIDFDVIAKGKQVNISWEVMEENNRGFYIEHSLNGTDWKVISFVESRHNSETPQLYSYEHINNFHGRQYYRIRQEDNNGIFNFSDIRTINLANESTAITIWPNPATDQVRVVSNEGQLANIQVFDLTGKMMIDKKLQGTSTIISISQLPTGTYLARIQGVDGTIANQKIIRQ